jgi:hypothetical protein
VTVHRAENYLTEQTLLTVNRAKLATRCSQATGLKGVKGVKQVRVAWLGVDPIPLLFLSLDKLRRGVMIPPSNYSIS